MPPKKSDIHHVTFHFYRSAVLLSVPASTSYLSLKQQLVPALQPFSAILPVSIPTSAADIQIWQEKTLAEGADRPEGEMQLETVEKGDKGVNARSIAALGWPRWKRVFVSFKGEDGFSEPVFTIPHMDDEEEETAE